MVTHRVVIECSHIHCISSLHCLGSLAGIIVFFLRDNVWICLEYPVVLEPGVCSKDLLSSESFKGVGYKHVF